ncbi:hypothetical protein [Sphingobacterium ginsenosidimutans]|uniref:Uncharacterized protein n=1 Tax=Sphingobacterium ginsenosidimutans TaxID=687845 RepID=A0ABP8AA02_9SPHI
MEGTNKTFEFHYEIDEKPYTVKGSISSFECEDDITIENIDLEKDKEFIFNVSLISNPKINLKIFDNTSALIYIIGYKGKEGQLGYIENNIFIPENDQNELVRQISVSILEILLINGSGHFTDQ